MTVLRSTPAFCRALVLALAALLLPLVASALTSPTVVKVSESVSGNAGYSRGFMIQWTPQSTDENLYQIQIRVGSTGSFVAISHTLAGNDYTTWYPSDSAVSTIPNGTKFYFRVIACKATLTTNSSGGVTGFSSIDEVSGAIAPYEMTYATNTVQSALNAPTSLAVTIPNFTKNGVTASDEGHIRITFNDNSDREDGYLFYIKKSGDASYPTSPDSQVFPMGLNDYTIGNFAFLFNSTTKTSGLEPGTTYNMKIQAYAGYNPATGAIAIQQTSAFSNEVTFTIPSLHPPTNFTGTAVDETKVTFNWLDNSNGEHGYVLQWYQPGALDQTFKFAGIGTAPNATTIDVNASGTSDDLMLPGLDLVWRVCAAYNPASNTTNLASNYLISPSVAPYVTVSTKFNKPENLTATVTNTDPATSATTIAFNWQDKSARETGYAVQARLTGGSTFTDVSYVPANTQTTSITFTDPGKTYEFQVVAFYATAFSSTAPNILSESAASNLVSVKMKDNFQTLYHPATVGTAIGTYTFSTTTGTTRTSLTVGTLPDGLTFNSGNSTITGTPTVGGVFNVPVTATFSDGFTANANLVLRIQYPAGAPTRPNVITARRMSIGNNSTVPLSDLFADKDTPQALRMATSLGNIDLILYSDLTPLTVANFLAYANSGDYSGAIFHRNSPGFVLQGGGYKSTGTAGANFVEVTRRATVQNEPGVTNGRGTLSLAKGSDPNSGTHDFFINLGDNSSQLDYSTGGFTAFGRVAGLQTAPVMTSTIDSILALPGVDSANTTISLTPSGSSTAVSTNPLAGNLGAGTKWPINDTSAGTSVDNTKMVTMNTFTSLPVLAYAITIAPNSSVATASINGSNLVISGVTNGTTNLQITATDVDGNTTMQDMAITVEDNYVPPQITQQPQALTKDPGQSADFTVVATGSSLHYQWRKNGVNIPNTDSNTYTIDPVSTSNQASYSVVVSNDQASVGSNSATLTVNSPAVVDTPASSQNVVRDYGTSVTFTVTASGAPTLTYQWKKGATSVTNDSRTSGATTASLTINSLLLTDDDLPYTCVVTNNFGNATSPPFNLTVNAVDTDGDGLTDDVELARTPPTSPTNADSDGDGYGDGLEVSLGTDPKDAAKTPSTYVVGARDSASLFAGLGLKYVPGIDTSTFADRLNNGNGVKIPTQWLMTNELTNEQFAAILDQAVRVMNVAEVTSFNSRQAVRYPKGGTGQIICYLSSTPPTGASTEPSCELDYNSAGRTFLVPVAVAKQPMRAVSWYGAYLATVALNNKFGYGQINVPATFSFTSADYGYLIPSYTSWEWAARGGSNPGYAYPTGGTVSTTQAKFNDTSVAAKPKNVASFAASKLGFHDLAGNVAEWVFESAPLDALTGITRGGSYADPSSMLGNGSDDRVLKTAISAKVGIRLAMREAAAPVFNATFKDKNQIAKAGDTVTISFPVTGAPNLTLQWYKNGVAMAGRTTSTLTIPSCTKTDAAVYLLKATSNGVSTTSTCKVAVLTIPGIAPTYYVVPNKSLTMTPNLALASGQTVTYDWFRDGNAAGNFVFKGGDHNKSLIMNDAFLGLTGTYTCRVSIPGSSPLDSETATFNVIVYDTPVVTVPISMGYAAQSSTYSYPPPYNGSANRVPTSWSITGLPKGLTYNSSSGVISGTPLVSGTFTIKFKASNPFGPSSEVSSTLQVVAHPLLSAATGANNYTARISRHSTPTGSSTGVNDGLGGRLDFTSSTIGYCTATLNLGGTVHKAITFYLQPQFKTGTTTGELQNVLTGTATINRTGKLALKLSITVTIDSGNGAIQTVNGSVGEIPSTGGNPVTTAAVVGWRNRFTSAVYDTISDKRNGYMTFALDAPVALANPDTTPQGGIYGSLTVASLGATTVAGKLADGTAYSCASYLAHDGRVLVFTPLYSNKGSVFGGLVLASNTRALTLDSSINWSRKDFGATSTDRNYKRGFAPLEFTMNSGGPYNAPAANTIVMGLDNVTAPAVNAQLTCTSGGLLTHDPLSQTFQIKLDQTAKMPTTNLNAVTFKVDKSTGIFSGTFTVQDQDPTSIAVKTLTRTASFAGIIVPKPSVSGKGIGVGYFLLGKLPNAAPDAHTLSTAAKLSGKVLLDKSP